MFITLIRKYKVFIGIVLCTILTIPFCIKKINKSIDASEVSEVYAEKMEHQNYGYWNTQNKMRMTDIERISDNCILNEVCNQVISLDTLESSSFCRKKNCIHEDINCVNKMDIISICVCGGEMYVLCMSDRNAIYYIYNNKATQIYRDKEQICGLWAYDDELYFSTDYGLYTMNMGDTKAVKCLSERPVRYYDLVIHDGKLYYADDSKYLFMIDLQSGEETKITSRKMDMPDIYDNTLYYRGTDYKLYCSKLDGSAEKLVVDMPIRTYYFYKNGIVFQKLYQMYTYEGPGGDYSSDVCYMDLDTKQCEKILSNVKTIDYMDDEGRIIYEDYNQEKTEQYYLAHPTDSGGVKGDFACYNMMTKESKPIDIVEEMEINDED